MPATLYADPVGYNDTQPYNGPLVPPTPVQEAERQVVDRVVIVNRQGVPYAELADYQIHNLRWQLGPSHSASFSVGVHDRNVGAIQTKTREVQFWRDGVCIWWGRLDKARRQGDRVEVGAVGLYDYLRYRFFGPPVSTRLSNRGFESSGSSIAPWSAVGCTATISSTIRARGDRAAKLVQSTTDADSYITQSYSEVHTGSPGNVVGFRVSAWVWVEAFNGPAYLERGLHAWTEYPGSTVFDERWQPLTASTPRGQWVRLELDSDILAPTGATSTVYVRLYAPNGTVYWDEVFFGPMTFVGSDIHVDIRTIMENVVSHALGKDSALNMGYSIPSTSQIRGPRLYSMGDHGSIEEAIRETIEADIYEVDVTWNAAATTRTIQFYHPRQGSYKPQYALEDGHGGRIVSLDGWEEGTTQTLSAPRVLGQGDGVDREYAEAVDTSLTDGVVFEGVRSAPKEVPLSGLDTLAAQDLARQRRPVRTPTVRCRAEGLVGNLLIGDTVPLRVLYSGWPTVDETMRATSLQLNGDDTLEVGLVTP